MKEIDQLREIFITGADEEERAENETQIREWEDALLQNEALQSWKEHDITKQIIRKTHETYIALCMQLLRRDISEQERCDNFAKQMAMMWFIRLAAEDPKAEIARIETEIKAALAATN